MTLAGVLSWVRRFSNGDRDEEGLGEVVWVGELFQIIDAGGGTQLGKHNDDRPQK